MRCAAPRADRDPQLSPYSALTGASSSASRSPFVMGDDSPGGDDDTHATHGFGGDTNAGHGT